jgi:hypothetical protein
MKRNNPKTNEPFKRGDVREDGYVFFSYCKVLRSDGTFKEIWLNPKVSDRIKTKDRTHKKAVYQRKTNRLPPNTANLTEMEKVKIRDALRL